MSEQSTRTTPTLDELRAEALAGGRRPRRFGALYVTEHWILAMRAYGWTIVVGALGQPMLYLGGLALGLAALIGQPIDDGTGVNVAYLDFVVPALLMSAAISVTSEEFTYPVMAGFKWRRYFYGFNASAISSPQIATGVMLGASVRVLIVSVPYYLFVWVIGSVETPETGWLTIPLSLLAGLGFGLPLMAYAASLEDDTGQFAMIQRFLVTPLFLFSGTFYAITVLPGWLQWIGWVSPLWHASQLGRAATYGADIPPAMIAVHLGYLTVLAVGGYLAARVIFTRRLAK